MHEYKIGLLIFTNSKVDGPLVLSAVEGLIKEESFGVIKAVQMIDPKVALVSSILDDYINTNLGMIVLVAKDADSFFPYSALEEVGQKNEKFLVTLNLDQNLSSNFLKVIKKVKSTKGKPRHGCDSSCR